MKTSKLRFVIGAVALVLLIGATASAGEVKMYWTDVGDTIAERKIQRANLDGSGVETLFSGLDVWGLDEPSQSSSFLQKIIPIAIDPVQRKLYWPFGGEFAGHGEIRRSNLDGSGMETFLTSPDNGLPYDLDNVLTIAIDPFAEQIFLGEPGIEAVHRFTLSGEYVNQLSPNCFPCRIALDVVAKDVYWNIPGEGPFIQRTNYSSDLREDVFEARGTSIAVDAANGHIYWIENGPGTQDGPIMRANFDGSDVQRILTNATPGGLQSSLTNASPGDLRNVVTEATPVDFAFDFINRKVYWTDDDLLQNGTRGIYRADIDALNSNIELLVSGLNRPEGIALDVQLVPEPSTGVLALLAVSLSGLFRWSRRRIA